MTSLFSSPSLLRETALSFRPSHKLVKVAHTAKESFFFISEERCFTLRSSLQRFGKLQLSPSLLERHPLRRPIFLPRAVISTLPCRVRPFFSSCRWGSQFDSRDELAVPKVVFPFSFFSCGKGFLAFFTELTRPISFRQVMPFSSCTEGTPPTRPPSRRSTK